jgi:hypothetical protein
MQGEILAASGSLQKFQTKLQARAWLLSSPASDLMRYRYTSNIGES